GGDQARDVVAIDLAPDALFLARGVALQKRDVVQTLAKAIDPAPAQRHVDRLQRGHRRYARALLVDPQPQLGVRVVVLGQPRLERRFAGEALDLALVDDGGRHVLRRAVPPRWARGEPPPSTRRGTPVLTPARRRAAREMLISGELRGGISGKLQPSPATVPRLPSTP